MWPLHNVRYPLARHGRKSNVFGSQAAVCIYSTLPPKESAFSVKLLDQPQTNHYISISPFSVNHGSYPETRFASQFSHSNCDEELASQVYGVFTASGKDIESICRTYFDNFHQWLPFISQHEFWRGFSSSGSQPEFSTLLLGMYLITHVPAQEPNHIDILDPAYFTAKNAWSRLQKNKEPSIVLIQAGLLLATYESGQALAERSRSTMVACAEMGYRMRLHKSLRKTAVGDPCGQIELEKQRRLWWGIVTLER
jgi:hypothetical protein